MCFSKKNNFRFNSISRFGLAIAAFHHFYVIFVKNDFLFMVAGMLFVQKVAFQVVIFNFHVFAMYGRSVGARVNFHFNIEEIQQWKVCLVYSADVSFQCYRNFVIAS